MTDNLIVTLRCKDQRGIVKAVADTVFDLSGNIVDSAQFWDQPSNSFSLRMEVHVPANTEQALEDSLHANLGHFNPVITVRSIAVKRRAIVMVTAADHCLRELLYQWEAGELGAEIVGVVSNHSALKPLADHVSLPFWEIPVTDGTKTVAEDELERVVNGTGADFIILARYMQVLSDEFCSRNEGRIINIHHSFLPGFKGAKPYHQAYDRGVKLIGATGHYVTEELDGGQIIAQSTVAVSHRDEVGDLIRKGRDTERLALARAVRLHLTRQVMVYRGRTAVFD
jgi:formyltetrahydrofolate deformylase